MKKYLLLVFSLLLATCGSVGVTTSNYYDYDFTTYIKICPVPNNVLWSPTVTPAQKVAWDTYKLYDPAILSAHKCTVGSINCPYGVARWQGQCTYNAGTPQQKANWSCVPNIRAGKLVNLIKNGTCTKPSSSMPTATVEEKVAYGAQVVKEGAILVSMLDNYHLTPEKFAKRYIPPKITQTKPGTLQPKVVATATQQPTTAQDTTKIDPVELSDGSFTWSDTLSQRPEPGMDYAFALSYNSRVLYNGVAGRNMQHNRDQLIREEDGSTWYYDGKMGRYELKDRDGKKRSPALQARAEKQETSDGKIIWTLSFHDGSRATFVEQQTPSVWYITQYDVTPGVTYTINYRPDGKVAQVITPKQEQINYFYDTRTDRLAQVTDPSGRSVFLTYYEGETSDGVDGDLKQIELVYGNETKTTTFTYTVVKTPDDEIDDTLSHNIKTITDVKGQIYVSNTYNDDRVASQTYGPNQGSFVYTTTNGKVTKTVATNRKGQTFTYDIDDKGNITKLTAPNGEVYSYTYNEDGLMMSETMPNGTVRTYVYDDKSNVTSYTETNGGATLARQYTYDGNNNLTVARDPSGVTTTYTYNGSNLPLTKTFQPTDGSQPARTTSFTYTPHRLPAKITVPDGQVFTYTYDVNDQIVQVDQRGSGDGTGSVITRNFTRDTYGNITSITDGEGNVTTSQYTDFDLMKQLTTPEGITKLFGYDATNNMTKATTVLENGAQAGASMSYDILDNLTKTTFDINAGVQGNLGFTYDPNDNLASTTNPEGTTRTYEYDIWQRPIKKSTTITTTDGVSQTISYNYTYNNVGHLIAITDPLGHKTTIEPNRLGLPVRVTNAEGTYAKLTYDAKNNLIEHNIFSSTGVLLQKTTSTYDAWNQQVSSIRHDVLDSTKKLASTKTYDQYGRVTSLTNPKGAIVSYDYDEFSRVAMVTDPVGKVTSYVYDNNNQVIAETFTTAEGKTLATYYQYDKDGRLIKTTNHVGYTQYFAYNKLNQLVSVTDAEGVNTKYVYDYVGNVLQTKQNDGKQAVIQTFTYDKNGNLTSLSDGNGNTSRFSYDGVDRKMTETLPDGSVSKWRYDADSNVIKATDPNKNIVTNSYDLLHRLVKRSINRGPQVGGVTGEVYAYDSLGKLTMSNDSQNNFQAFNYDGLGNLIKETNGGKDVTYGYDAMNDMISVTYPSGKSFGRSYDIIDRLTKLDSTNRSPGNIAEYAYDSATLQGISYGNYTKTNYTYDALLRPREMHHTDFKTPSPMDTIDYRYTYDKVNNVRQDGLDTYRYDNIYQLTTVSYNNGDLVKRQNGELYKGSQTSTDYNQRQQQRNYDSVGNRKTEYNTVPGVPIENDIHIYSNCHPGGNIGHTNNLEQQYSGTFYQTSCPLTEQDAIIGGSAGGKGKASVQPNDAYQDYLSGGTMPVSGAETLQSFNEEGITNTEEGRIAQRDENVEANTVRQEPTRIAMATTDIEPRMLHESFGRTIEPSNDRTIEDETIAQRDDESVILSDNEGSPKAGSNQGTKIAMVGSPRLLAKGGGGGGGNGGGNGNGNGQQGTNATKNNGNANYNGNGADNGLKKGRYKDNAKNAKEQWNNRKNGNGNNTTSGAIVPGYEAGLPVIFTGDEPQYSGNVKYYTNNLNQYLSITTDNLSGIALKYDKNGNLIQNEKFRFQYDYRNRLIKAWTFFTTGTDQVNSDPATWNAETDAASAQEYLIVSFTYDTLGRRVTKRVDRKSNVGRFIKYIYSDENAIEEERFYNIGEGREQLKEYVYGNGTDDLVKQYIEKQGMQNQQRFYKDYQGSVVAIADEYGKIVESYRYDARGNMILGYQSNSIKFNLSPSDKNPQTNTANGSKSWITNARLYTSREWDEEIEMYYYRARHYDARMGRFIQRDPLGYNAGDLGLYRYVGNNPVNFTDPFGLEKQMTDKTKAQIVKEFMATTREDCKKNTNGWTLAGACLGGDFKRSEDTACELGAKIACGEVPIVPDARDTIANLRYCKGWGGCSLDVGGSAVGFIPVAGSLKYTDEVLALYKKTNALIEQGLKNMDKMKSVDNAAGTVVQQTLKNMKYSISKLQHTFEHAKDFGITSNRTKEVGEKFAQVLQKHVDTFAPKLGTYRGNIPVNHFFDATTKRNVMLDLDGNLIGARKLSDDQVANLLRNGNIQ